MPLERTFSRWSLALAAVLLGLTAAPALGAGIPTTSDEARSWAAVQRMKAMDVMHMIDIDKKGYVTREEFMKFQEQLFDRMDRNHDGKVDAKEWMGKTEAATSKK